MLSLPASSAAQAATARHRNQFGPCHLFERHRLPGGDDPPGMAADRSDRMNWHEPGTHNKVSSQQSK